jgi:hypothetical protein
MPPFKFRTFYPLRDACNNPPAIKVSALRARCASESSPPPTLHLLTQQTLRMAVWISPRSVVDGLSFNLLASIWIPTRATRETHAKNAWITGSMATFVLRTSCILVTESWSRRVWARSSMNSTRAYEFPDVLGGPSLSTHYLQSHPAGKDYWA